MDSFQDNLEYEKRLGLRVRAQFSRMLEEKRKTWTWIRSLEEQRAKGDFYLTDADGIRTNHDLKFERSSSRTGSMFFETWSNLSLTIPRLGWGITSGTDRIWYHFEDAESIAVLEFAVLKRFLEGETGNPRVPIRLLSYPERSQYTHEQKNLTMGRLVGFDTLPKNVFRGGYCLRGEHAVSIPRDEFIRRMKASASARKS